MRHRGGIRWAVVAAAVAVPVAVSAYRLTRPSDYTRTREFKALVGEYLI